MESGDAPAEALEGETTVEQPQKDLPETPPIAEMSDEKGKKREIY